MSQGITCQECGEEITVRFWQDEGLCPMCGAEIKKVETVMEDGVIDVRGLKTPPVWLIRPLHKLERILDYPATPFIVAAVVGIASIFLLSVLLGG